MTKQAVQLRPKFHITPPQGLLNDPNGFIEYQGQYHLFYQWNPHACAHGAKYWGHCVSRDLVNWAQLPAALAPEDSYDKNGCYSGSAFVLDDQLHLFYTGNLKDADGTRYSTQVLAKAMDDTLEKYEKIGPVIHHHPEGYTAHFRDPKIWQHDGLWYCVIGAQTETELGQVLLYVSEDAHQWQCKGPIAGNNINSLTDFGYMFECPDLFNVNGSDVLIGCPQGIKDHGSDFQNIHNNGYFVGQLDYQSCTYQHGEFKPLDQGFEFYAPQTTESSDGRRLLSAWVGLPEEDQPPTIEDNWVHALSLVRELHVRDGKLMQQPVTEHQLLRGEKVEYKNIDLSEQNHFSLATNNCFELQLQARDIERELRIKVADEGDRYLELTYDPATGDIQLKRHGEYLPGTRECQVAPSCDLDLQIFFDHSIVEIFINGGEQVFTSCVFPQSAATDVTLQSQKSCIIAEFIKYDY